MEPLPDVGKLVEMLNQVHGVLSQALPNIEDPELKRLVSLMTKDLKTHEAELAEVYPQAVQELNEEHAQLQRAAVELRQRADAWQARVAALEEGLAKAPPTRAPFAASPAAPPAPTTKPPAAPVPAAPADESVWKQAD